MSLYEPLYISNQAYVYRNGNELRIVKMKGRVRNSGVEGPKPKQSSVPSTSSDDERLSSSVSRSKRLIMEYAANNPWDWYFTGTIDAKKFPRYDLEKFHAHLTRFLRELPYKVTFLLVPEPHKDGAIHVHGLLRGIPMEALHRFVIGDTMGKHIADKVRKGEVVYNWFAYANKFGYCDLEPIKTVDGVSKYITKYITKDLLSITPASKQCFWHSRGLKIAELLFKGTLIDELPIPADKWYNAEHCSIATVPYDPILAQTLEGYII